MSQTTTTNHETKLKEVYNTFDSLIKRGLKVGLFQDTAQVIVCHNSLDAIRQIINEQSKQQGGSNYMDSGKILATTGKDSETIQAKRKGRKQRLADAAKASSGQSGSGQPGAEIVDPVNQLPLID